LLVQHPLTVRRAAIGQGQVQAGAGFIEVEVLVEGEMIDLLVIPFGFGLRVLGVLLRVVDRLFFA
jgi:hypothetical protein